MSLGIRVLLIAVCTLIGSVVSHWAASPFLYHWIFPYGSSIGRPALFLTGPVVLLGLAILGWLIFDWRTGKAS